MSELIPILDTLIADVRAGRPAALCTVVKTQGSTPQTPGAALLLRSDFTTLGTLGGGCVEAEVCKRAFECLQRDTSELLDFDLDHDYGWDDGLICGGRMHVAVVSVSSDADLHPFKAALANASRRRPAQLPIVVTHESKRREYRMHLEVSPTLVIAGAGHVGQAVARLAVGLDFHVVVIDDRADIASRARFPEGVELIVDDIAGALRRYALDAGCYVVIVTRGHRHDAQALDAVVRRPVGYIGMIGSKRKSAMILRGLADAGVSQELLGRVHTPIGVSIGAVTVNEIAVSIVGELIQVRRQTTPKLIEGPVEQPE